ncbi:MAG: methyltransferase domain-containing protein [Elusimicrobia bacterium]|nr:methyltransferase domain-containing protein [Elusimicrobiota bacterium]
MIKIGLIIAGVVVIAAAGLLLRRHRHGPCPWWLIVLLENPLVQRVMGSKMIIERMGLMPGMKVLDVGCGPGRISIPMAKYIGPQGEVVSFDIQEKMLEILKKRIKENAITNIRVVQGGAGASPPVLISEKSRGGEGFKNYFDRAILVTVLGEIPDRKKALEEIYLALKPGGVLSVTEALTDPDYLSKKTIIKLAEEAGFKFKEVFGNYLSFTINLVKE